MSRIRRIDPEAVLASHRELVDRWSEVTNAIAEDVLIYGQAYTLWDRRPWWRRIWDTVRSIGW
jgi:hypothetical protein